MAEAGNIRNIVLLGHGGSGKTSLAEAILHKTGVTNRLGSVNDKTSILDYYEEEKQRQHSIKSSVAFVNYGGKLINIIDTPGSPDFMGPAIKAMSGAETAVIVINATSGVEINTRKFFELTTKANMPRLIVINKIDSENIQIPEILKNIKRRSGRNAGARICLRRTARA